MLNYQQYYDETGDPAIAREVTGQWIGKAELDARQRAKLAALWVNRRLDVKPTVKAAVTIFGKARSTSASAQRIVNAMLPSSICVRRNPAAAWIALPVSVLPVNAM